jgi:hypothetical protein
LNRIRRAPPITDTIESRSRSNSGLSVISVRSSRYLTPHKKFMSDLTTFLIILKGKIKALLQLKTIYANDFEKLKNPTMSIDEKQSLIAGLVLIARVDVEA